jgi:hypothetical protein
MKVSACILILALTSMPGLKAQRHELRGRVTEAGTQQPLTGATIQIANTTRGVVTNEKGYYSLPLDAGSYQIKVSFVGYSPDSAEIVIPFKGYLDFAMEVSSVVAEEVIVSARDRTEHVTGTETGVVELSMKEVKLLPALMGETDFMRVIQLTPGIQAANDANMGFYVRGGAADQNLVLLDNIPVYNPGHVMGFFSVFNSDAIRSTRLIKSGMPANYGGRISSIVDIHSEHGNFQTFGFGGNIGLISSKFCLQGPLISEKVSFLLSYRRSYIDEVLKPAIRPLAGKTSTFYNNSKYGFHDFNAKISWKVTAKDMLSLTGYFGSDNYSLGQFQFDFTNTMHWGNDLMALNWNHNFNRNWSLRQTAGYTRYRFRLNAGQSDIKINLFSKAGDLAYKSELTHSDYSNQIISMGGEVILHEFQPNNLDAMASGSELDFGSNRQLNSLEAALFYNHEFNMLEALRLNVGFRYIYYEHRGPYYAIQKNEIGEITDSTFYATGTPVKTYMSPEPRISLRYRFDKETSLKASATINRQFTHMVSSSVVTLPTDVWLPSTANIKPQRGTQYTLGYYKNLKENTWLTSVSCYYKAFYNQIELLYGFVNNFQDNSFEESMTFGRSRSYGLELYLQKVRGSFTGWLAYTLSKTDRQFDDINQGRIYPAKYDRRHDINLVAAYDINTRWKVSGTFIFATGNAMTLPEFKYILEGNLMTGYSGKNSYRMPAYHRLDVSLTYITRKMERFESAWNLSIYNVYNRANPFYIYFQLEGNVYEYNLKITPKQVTIFPIIPSISWSFKF